jgi:hypothetical protein
MQMVISREERRDVNDISMEETREVNGISREEIRDVNGYIQGGKKRC